MPRWIKNKLYLKEMEFYFNIPTKTYGFRVVRRKLRPRKDGWREYGDGKQSISVPLPIFQEFVKEMKAADKFIHSCEYSYVKGKQL